MIARVFGFFVPLCRDAVHLVGANYDDDNEKTSRLCFCAYIYKPIMYTGWSLMLKIVKHLAVFFTTQVYVVLLYGWIDDDDDVMRVVCISVPPCIHVISTCWVYAKQSKVYSVHLYRVHCNDKVRVSYSFVPPMYNLFYCYRVEFDAYRSDLEALQAAPRVGDATAAQKLDEAQQRYQAHKEKFERLRSDVSVKMKFLDENRVTGSSLLSAVKGCR